ncbi:MAG: MOSC N-terminal beta barrel domain-containing protein [Verrucomicrobiota bacterium]
MSGMPKVAHLFRYPIKSSKLQEVNSLDFDVYGPTGDRRWLITTNDHSDIITQRKYPKLSSLEVEIISRNSIRLRAPEKGDFTLQQSNENPLVKTHVWKNYFQAKDAGDEIAAWLSEFLGVSVRLVGLDPGFDRPVKNHPEDQVAFADGYPILIISKASLEDLNQKLDTPVSIKRFRPNIVIENCQAFEEDEWKRIRIGDITLKASGQCSRCIMTTVDPEKSAFDGPEPLKTLSGYRRVDKGVVFGQNYVHQTKSGKISIGDDVEILDRS